MDITEHMHAMGRKAREASRAMARADGATRNRALLLIADAIERDAAVLRAANQEDMEAARAGGLEPALLDRLALSDGAIKTISSETTFSQDLVTLEDLSTELLKCTERLSERLKAKGLVGDTVTLKLKTAGFKLRTRARHLMMPTQLANVLYECGMTLLQREVDGTPFRLIGIGVSGLETADGSDPSDLLEPQVARKAAAERAMDKVRTRFGRSAVIRGKLYSSRPETESGPLSEEEADDLEGRSR